ncbi:MAG: hypothetical protein IPK80_21295 [Nannocystis sp.]|nr:hypothetical protein [Nannocystis sp.]
MIISVHNTKGGVGTTALVRHLTHLATSRGWRVHTRSPTSADDPIDADLILIDGPGGGELAADVTIIPISSKLAHLHADALADGLRGLVIYLPNTGYKLSELAPHLNVAVAEGIPYSNAIAHAAEYERVIWEDPELRHTPGAEALLRSLNDVLRLAGLDDKRAHPDPASPPAAAPPAVQAAKPSTSDTKDLDHTLVQSTHEKLRARLSADERRALAALLLEA